MQIMVMIITFIIIIIIIIIIVIMIMMMINYLLAIFFSSNKISRYGRGSSGPIIAHICSPREQR